MLAEVHCNDYPIPVGERILNDLPSFDEVHVVSDLHMGGRPGYQILREGKRLAGFVRWVGNQRPKGRVALLLNGDVIDSLAEDIGGYIAIEDAVTMLQRIFEYQTFLPVWDALAEFVTKPNRTLIIVIGNHDVELAFPVVQRAILKRLAADDLTARARIEFSTMGAGYPCLVGNARVFCTHGNEVDPWNYNRYEDLAKAARRLNAGRALDPSEWQPNAGTKMVKDVMNEVKRKFAWIDLLKPEAQAAAGVLLALDPTQIAKINRLLPIIGVRARGGSGSRPAPVRRRVYRCCSRGPALLPCRSVARSESHSRNAERAVCRRPERRPAAARSREDLREPWRGGAGAATTLWAPGNWSGID